jgi:hypothetical protein
MVDITQTSMENRPNINLQESSYKKGNIRDKRIQSSQVKRMTINGDSSLPIDGYLSKPSKFSNQPEPNTP